MSDRRRSAARPSEAAEQEAVVITGAGAVTALGRGVQDLWRGVSEGRDGLDSIRRFATSPFTVDSGGVVPGTNQGIPDDDLGELCLEYARLAAVEACGQAGLEPDDLRDGSVGLVLGTSLGDLQRHVHTTAEALARELGLTGPILTVSTACTSSANALGVGIDLLRQGDVEVAIAGGTDVLSETVFAGFHALGVLCTGKCTPFGFPVGTTLGEGAGILVLELESRAASRGAKPLASLAGYGLSNDAFHETSPDPTGSGVSRAAEAALRHAGVGPDEIGYVNAHGSGTAANDSAEWRAIQRVFGERASRLPVSSVKGHIGHAQGAAGVLELIVTLLAMQRDAAPPTLRCDRRRPHTPDDTVAQRSPRPAHYDHALCSSSAFGGANAAVVLSRAPRPAAARRTRAVSTLGFGVALADSPRRRELAQCLEELGIAAPESVAELQAAVPTADPRRMSDAATHLTAAVAGAFRNGEALPRGDARERAGLVVGTTTISAVEARAFRRSVHQRGIDRCSTTAFANMVLNAAAGATARTLSLKGVSSTVTIGEGSGLAALVYAAGLAADRDEVGLLVAAGLDAAGSPGDAGDAADEEPADGDGAAALLLSADPGTSAAGRLAGWAFAGPDAESLARSRALRRAGLGPAQVDLTLSGCSDASGATPLARRIHAATAPFGPATRSILACAAALAAVQRGEIGSALVSSAGGESSSCAVVLATGV